MSHDHSSMDMDMSGMDNSDSTSASMMMGKMYIHGSLGDDMVLFASWAPTSKAAYGGICVGLFLLAVGYRFLKVIQRAAEGYWRRDVFARLSAGAQPEAASEGDASSSSGTSMDEKTGIPSGATKRDSQPATPSYQAVAYEDSIQPAQAVQGDSTGAQAPARFGHLPHLVQRNLDPARSSRGSLPFVWRNDIPRGLLEAFTAAIGYALMLIVMTFNIWFILSIVVGLGVGETLFGRYAH